MMAGQKEQSKPGQTGVGAAAKSGVETVVASPSASKIALREKEVDNSQLESPDNTTDEDTTVEISEEEDASYSMVTRNKSKKRTAAEQDLNKMSDSELAEYLRSREEGQKTKSNKKAGKPKKNSV